MSFGAILAFGYNKLCVLIGTRGVNGTLRVHGIGESAYSGFREGSWNDPDSLGFAIAHALRLAESSSGLKVNKLYVGVPDSFCFNINKEVGVCFTSAQIVNDSHIQSLYSQGNNFDIERHIITDINPIYYVLDDELRVIDPMGSQCTKLSGLLSYILVSEAFYQPLIEVFRNLELDYYFTSHFLAKSQYYLEQSQLDPCAALIDVQPAYVSVAIAKGKGLLSYKYFELGAESIVAKLCEELDVTKPIAESIKRRAMLSLIHGEGDVYELAGREGNLTFDAKRVNEIIIARLAAISYNVLKCLSSFEYEYPQYLKYYLIGAENIGVRGANDVLSKQLKRTVEAVKPAQFLTNQQLYDKLALLCFALEYEQVNYRSDNMQKRLARLVSWFKNRTNKA